jgi:hypothetical protein
MKQKYGLNCSPRLANSPSLAFAPASFVRKALATAILASIMAPLCLAADHHGVPTSLPHAPSISLSPAVIAIQAAPGQSTTQKMTISNQTAGPIAFDLEAYDVLVQEGKRVFVRAGETPGGIAKSMVFVPSSLTLQAGESATVRATVTVPPNPTVRAVVALFQGKSTLAMSGGVGMTGSLGTLVTFTVSKQFHVESLPMALLRASSESLKITEHLSNTGSEPVVPKGTLALVNSSGTLVGKVPIAPQRLLPGEAIDFSAEYLRPLKPGKYRALISMKDEAGLITASSEFVVP